MNRKKRNRIAASLRRYRVWHKYIGLSLSILLLISALTGLLLAWKKNVDLLQPATQKGQSSELNEWMPLEQLAQNATEAFLQNTGYPNAEIDKMDVRPSKGIVKVIFTEGDWEVQVDGASGDILSVAQRHSDWIERLHDGSIVSDLFKLISMNFLGIGLVVLIAAGIWLWYGPKKIRRLKRN